jgi:hypothetical protein
MNCLEHSYMHSYQHKVVLTGKQNTGDISPLREVQLDSARA